MADILKRAEELSDLFDNKGSERLEFNNGSNFNRNPTGKNQYTKGMRTFEEVQKAIDEAPPKIIDGKEFPLTKKDLRGEGKYYKNKIVGKKELERFPELKIPGAGKPVTKPTSKLISNKKYDEFIKIAQGSAINMDRINNFGHFAPKLKEFLTSTANTGPIGASVNRAAQGYDAEILKIAEQQRDLIIKKPKGYEKLLKQVNAKAAELSKNFTKLLPEGLKGTLGYFNVDEKGNFELKGVDKSKTFAGLSGDEKIYKDMTGAERKAFGKKQSVIQNLIDKIPGTMRASNLPIKNFIDLAPLPGPLGKLKNLKKFEEGGRVSYKSGSYLFDLFKDQAKYLKTPSGKRDITYFGGIDALDAIYQLLGLPGLYAGGGIAKQAGVDSGPPPISGPTPDGDEGLPAAFKSVKKT